MELSHRIQSIVDSTNLTPSKLASYVGLQWPKTIYDALAGKTEYLSARTANLILTAFPTLNPEWLMHGQGEMTTDGKPLIKLNGTIAPGIKQRVLEFCNAVKITKNFFARKCGLATGIVDRLSEKSYIDTIERILAAFPAINRTWLITGEGEMFNSNDYNSIQSSAIINPINSAISTGSGNAYNYGSKAENSQLSHGYAPLIPQFIKSTPNLDVLHYARENHCPTCPIAIDGTSVDLWYSVDDSALNPNFRLGDLVALSSDTGSIIPGKVYVIDTYSQGLIFRILLNEDKTYICRSTNKELYPDFSINKSDVIRIYKVVGMFRFNTNL